MERSRTASSAEQQHRPVIDQLRLRWLCRGWIGFTKLFTTTYSGSPFKDLQDYLDSCHEVIRNMGIVETIGVDFASFRLSGSAKTWWRDYCLVRPAGSPALTWNQFSQLFLEKFLPITKREKYRRQFERLQQGSMIVTQYETRDASVLFNPGSTYYYVSSYFAPYLVMLSDSLSAHKELNLRQRRWLELLKDYDITIVYYSGKANVVVDALSRKSDSMGSLAYIPRIRDRQYDDPHLFVLRYMVHHGGAKHVTLGDDRVLRVQGRDLQQHYWWRRMKKDIVAYVTRCLNCQYVKYEHKRPGGLLQKIAILE
ncbi:uncharacterized protein [Nicotiana sylvestris]|uniref:uncharacterized protein n=1 Tax=Nicotiana sylvestris TaxID=4096 RepID=UPI00388CE33F